MERLKIILAFSWLALLLLMFAIIAWPVLGAFIALVLTAESIIIVIKYFENRS